MTSRWLLSLGGASCGSEDEDPWRQVILARQGGPTSPQSFLGFLWASGLKDSLEEQQSKLSSCLEAPSLGKGAQTQSPDCTAF